MQFVVSRTSGYSNEKPPCEDAFVLKNPFRGKILWGVEINSLEDLLAFCEKQENELVITKSIDCGYPKEWDGTWEIEIYDSYRE